MVRAAGSYPAGHKFESHRRYHDYNTEFSFYIWPVGQAVKTPPFHGGNMGSSPVRVTRKRLRIGYNSESFSTKSTLLGGLNRIHDEIPRAWDEIRLDGGWADFISSEAVG